jgi:hypothetical protein
MPTLADKIKQGVLFEERFVQVIADDILRLDAFAALTDDKKHRITTLLTVMRDDSIQHEQLLQKIYDKY